MNCKNCNAPLEYLNKSQACELLGVDRGTIYNWIKKGKLELHKVKGFKGLRVKRSDLELLHNK